MSVAFSEPLVLQLARSCISAYCKVSFYNGTLVLEDVSEDEADAVKRKLARKFGAGTVQLSGWCDPGWGVVAYIDFI